MRPDERVLAFAAQGLGAEVRGCAAIGGGRNSRVFRLETDRGPFALKQYRDPHRLRTESAAFAFLRGQGVTEVPEVLLADESVPAGIYSFIEGERVDGTNVAQRDVDDCVRFVGRLRTSGKSAEAAAMGAAAESCFSLDAVEANIAGRLERLDERDRRTDCEMR